MTIKNEVKKLPVGALSKIAREALDRQKAARGGQILITPSASLEDRLYKKPVTLGIKVAENVSDEFEETLKNIVELSGQTNVNFFLNSKSQRLIKKIAVNALKDKEGYKKEIAGEEKISRKKMIALVKLTGHYQAALEVISAINCSMIGPIPGAAHNLLQGSHQLNYERIGEFGDAKNEALLKNGIESLKIINDEYREQDVAFLLEKGPKFSTFSALAGLNG